MPIFVETAAFLPTTMQLPAPLNKNPKPELCSISKHQENSIWWQFQNLLDIVRSNPAGSTFIERQSILRQRFNVLEARWVEEAEGLRRAWSASELGQRNNLCGQLSRLTNRAAQEATHLISDLVQQWAPDFAHRAFDSRWR